MNSERQDKTVEWLKIRKNSRQEIYEWLNYKDNQSLQLGSFYIKVNKIAT